MVFFRYPAVILLLCVTVGTLVGHEIGPALPVAAIIAGIIGLIVLFGIIRLPSAQVAVVLALLAAAVAFARAQQTFQEFPSNDIGTYAGTGESMQYFGSIVRWPVLKRHKTAAVCRIDSLVSDGVMSRTSGRVLLEIPRETTRFSLGDDISFFGRLYRPGTIGFPGQFDYADYLADKGVRGIVTVSDPARIMIRARQMNLFGSGVLTIRQWILNCLGENLRDIPAALASGFLIGETHNIPDDIYIAFRRTGTMHLLAVSGSNVALVLVAALIFLRIFRLRRAAQAIVLLVVIVLFTHLSYNQPSVVRASIMAAMVLIGRVGYRRIDMHNMIAAAAVILILADPGNLYDIGFQLSFAVTWGLILFLPSINRFILRYRMSQAVRYILLIVFSSIIATVISAPITGYYFGEVSVITVISNLVIVPMVSLAVLGIMVLLAVEVIFPGISIIPGILLDRLLGLINMLVVWFGQWKMAMVGTGMMSAATALYIVGAVGVVGLALHLRQGKKLLAGIGVIGIVLLILSLCSKGTNERPGVEVFNLGSMHAVLIHPMPGAVIISPSGESDYDILNAGLLPYLKRRGGELPRYFIFLESAYRTEFRLERTSEIYPDLAFRPIATGGPLHDATVWSVGETVIEDKNDSCWQFDIFSASVSVVSPEGMALIVADDIRGISSLSQSILDDADYVIAGFDGDLAGCSVGGWGDLSRLVLVLHDQVRDGKMGKKTPSNPLDSIQVIVPQCKPVFLAYGEALWRDSR